MDGDELIRESETSGGLGALKDILQGLTDEEFVGEAVRGLVGVDEPSDEVAAIVAAEGARRVNRLLDAAQHVRAVQVGAVACSPEAFLSACRAGLDAHKDEADPMRAQILELFGDCPELVHQLRVSLES